MEIEQCQFRNIAQSSVARPDRPSLKSRHVVALQHGPWLSANTVRHILIEKDQLHRRQCKCNKQFY